MSAISWTDHSFAPWFGCTRVSPACDHCYAEDWTVRRFHKAGWGTQTPRIRSAASTWQKPKTWNRAAAQQGTPLFLFCSELSDVFDNQAPDAWRADLWRLIRETPALIWLVLTKRPQNMRRMLPPDWGTGYTNVWLGVSAENQRETDRRLPILCHTPCLRRFVSAEPLLGAVNLLPWLGMLDWVITGCESLPGKRPGRPTDLACVRTLRDQCQRASVSFWLKQLVIADKVHELPELDGRTWTERPLTSSGPRSSGSNPWEGIMTDHCNGCGRPGMPVSREPSSTPVEEGLGDLFLVPASVWPDGCARYLCRKCNTKFARHTKRLVKAGSGYLT